MLWLFLLGCQDPFGTDRHDLVGDRIAAVAARTEGGVVSPRAALIADGRPWSDEAVALDWFFVEDPDAVAGLEPPGLAPPLVAPPEATHLALVATFPSGAVRRAFLELGGEGTLVDLEHPDVVDPGEAITVHAEAEGTLRWMSVGGRGTFTELDPTTTAWVAAEVEQDDGEAVASEPLGEGPVTFLALAIDREGGNDFRAEDLFVGTRPPGLWTTGDRFLPAPNHLAPGFWRATLAAEDTSPTGLRLVDPVAATATETPFDPGCLLVGACSRDELVGTSVVVEAR